MKEPIETTLNRWIDGELDPSEVDALNQRLLNDPKARRDYYGLLLVDHSLATNPAAASRPVHGPVPSTARKATLARFRWNDWRVSLSLAAVAMIGLTLTASLLWPTLRQSEATPAITGSADSRITIAQRQDPSSGWLPGEVMRIDRGSATVRLANGITARFEGPCAVELLDTTGNIRLLEGGAAFDVRTGAGLEVHVPGGMVRDIGTRFSVKVWRDGDTDITVNTGMVEVTSPALNEPYRLTSSQSTRLDVEGMRHPVPRDLPIHLDANQSWNILFEDDFAAEDGTLLTEHSPLVGLEWSAQSEREPTTLSQSRLDTSFGARELVARLAPHPEPSARDVYLFHFDFLQPEHMQDKEKRQDGFESITILCTREKPLFSIRALAEHGHRWFLHNDTDGSSSPLTLVGALWPHKLTVCFDLNGRVTLHDGPTAQAPIIAELFIADPLQVGALLLTNRTGGDLALNRIEAGILTENRDEDNPLH